MKIISLSGILNLSLILIFFGGCKTTGSERVSITDNLSVISGDINGAVITSGKHNLVIYGDPGNSVKSADMVLFTHAARDVVWAGATLVNEGSKAVVPENEAGYFINPDSVWTEILKKQFHDYRQKTSRVPVSSIPVSRTVKGGDTINWRGITIKVIGSRGYTEGAVSYIIHVDDIDVAFVGDLIYGDGKIPDLYSMQDEIPELDMWGYHGFAARMADLIESLRRIKDLNPDIIIPVRGPVINNPEVAVNKLIGRLQLVYKNYLSVNSFRWYRSTGWGKPEDGTVNLANRVLNSSMKVNWMPFAKMQNNPYWLKNTATSKLIISKDKTAFLIDCGIKKAYNDIMNLEHSFSCSDIEGIFISHYHDDHTDYINKVREKYNCPVYVTKELKDILNNPQAYKMPAMTSEPINNLTIVPEGETITWKEFTFTFHYFPGQTIYHDAILIKNNNTGENIFIAGDSFSPSGLDDYCLQNRNLLDENSGYIYCLGILKELPDNCWITNEHVEQSFRFTKEQLGFMLNNLTEREKLLQELFPWDNPNYGIDPQWARFYPYRQVVASGKTETNFSVIVYNHSGYNQEFTIHPNTGDMACTPEKLTITVQAGKEGKANFSLKISDNKSNKNKIITADISFGKWHLHKWCESVIQF